MSISFIRTIALTFFSTSTICFYYSCGGPNADATIVENKHVEESDICIMDFSINNVIRIDDSNSIKKVRDSMGDNKKFEWTISELDEGLFFLNKKEDKYLKLSQTLGAGGTAFNYFEVGYKNEKKSFGIIYNRSEFNDFKTESGVFLGMGKTDLIKLKGTKMEANTKDNVEVLVYKINDFEKCRFDPEKGEYSFEMKFFFRDNKLIRFEFGYPIP